MKLPPLLVYSVLRIAAFLVPLAVLYVFFPIMRELWWLTVIFSALIGMSISMLFLRKPLNAASAALAERRQERSEQQAAETAIEDDES